MPDLAALPKKQYKATANWPQGTRQPFSNAIAEHFCSLLATCDTSLCSLLQAHPELPPYSQLDNWRRKRPNFNDAWKHAMQQRAHFLAEKCAQLHKDVTPKTAHVVRVQFDILRWLAAKFSPSDYGEKIIPQQQTTVNVGISISQERLNDIRTKLNATRASLASNGRNELPSNSAPAER